MTDNRKFLIRVICVLFAVITLYTMLWFSYIPIIVGLNKLIIIHNFSLYYYNGGSGIITRGAIACQMY